MQVVVVLEPCEEGGYTAHVPSLPGCISEGGTVEEALANIREAFEVYVEPTEDDLIVGVRDIVKTLDLDWRPAEITSVEEGRDSGGIASPDLTETQPAIRPRSRAIDTSG